MVIHMRRKTGVTFQFTTFNGFIGWLVNLDFDLTFGILNIDIVDFGAGDLRFGTLGNFESILRRIRAILFY